MIIDAFTHGMHGDYLEPVIAAGGKWTKERFDRSRFDGIYPPQFLDVALRVEQLNAYGIDHQVVTPNFDMDVNHFPGDAATQVAIARAINDNMARLMDHSKGRLIGTVNIPVVAFEEGGRQEMDRAIRQLGLKALSIPTTIAELPLDQPRFEPFWAYAAAMGVPVYAHPCTPPSRNVEPVYDLPHTFDWPFETTLMISHLVFSGIMERYPNLRIVTHHLGGMVSFFMGRVIETNDATATNPQRPAPLPKPLLDYFSLFYFDTAVGGSTAAIRCSYEVFGASHIVFATDAPFGPAGGATRLATYPDLIRSLGLSAAETEAILGGNAQRMLNMA